MVNVGDPLEKALPRIVLDRLNRVLIGADGARVELPFLSLRLLESLAEESPAFVRSDALLRRVWPDTHIGADVLKQRVRLLRVSLASAGYDARLLDGVRGEGYALRARLVDADAAMADVPPRPGPDVTTSANASSTGAASHVATWRRVTPAAFVVVALVASALLGSRRGDTPSRGSGPTTMGPAPVRLGIAAPSGSAVAVRLMDLLGNTPNLLLVPLPLASSPAGTDACAVTSLVHLCLSVVPTAEGNTLAVTQRRTGAMVIRETVDASPRSIELAALSVAQLAAPGALRWLGGSARGDVVFDQYRGAIRALQQCDTVMRAESLTRLRRIAAQSPDFLPARALLAALAVEAAGPDAAQIDRISAEAAAVLARTPDLPLAYLAIARGAALTGDSVAGRVAMTRAVRLLPVLNRFYDESAAPRAPSRCALAVAG